MDMTFNPNTDPSIEALNFVQCPTCDAQLDVGDFEAFSEIECPACNSILTVPGRYEEFLLLHVLGHGATGTVYRARDEQLARDVALKVIRPECMNGPGVVEAALNEAKVMARLNHENICKFYSSGVLDGRPYYVMELLTGKRLEEPIQNGKRYSEIRALEIAHDVANGLWSAEKAGLLHGDLKLSNILTDDEGSAKVVGFRMGVFQANGEEAELWNNPYYISPEKARKERGDARSDQYSLGAVLFHLMSGHAPFEEANPAKTVLATLEEETPSLKIQNRRITKFTSDMVMKMMAKSPNQRYEDYVSLIEDIEQALLGAQQARNQRSGSLRNSTQRIAEQPGPTQTTVRRRGPSPTSAVINRSALQS